MTTLDEKIAAVREMAVYCESRLYPTLRLWSPALRAVLADLEAQRAPPAQSITIPPPTAEQREYFRDLAARHRAYDPNMVIGGASTPDGGVVDLETQRETLAPPAQSADDERERGIRQLLSEWPSSALSPRDDAAFLLHRLDAARLALSGAQADLALAREEIGRLRAPAGADAVEIARGYFASIDVGSGIRLEESERKVALPVLASLIARAIEAAEARGLATGMEAAVQIALNPGFIQARDTEWDEGVNYAKRFIAARLLRDSRGECYGGECIVILLVVAALAGLGWLTHS